MKPRTQGREIGAEMKKWRVTSGEWRAKRRKLSSRVKRGILFFSFSVTTAIAFFVSPTPAQEAPTRPPVLGIARVTIAAPHEGGLFYTKYLGLPLETETCLGLYCENILNVNARQQISILDQKPEDGPESTPANNYLRYVAYETTDLQRLNRYLVSQGLKPSEIYDFPGYGNQFWIVDPEGNRIGFVQSDPKSAHVVAGKRVSSHIIHIGFIVRDQAATNHFYKDVLGFRPYWHGGMKDDETSWISLQVPDGTDWVEFMVNLPPDPDQHLRGVMNHIALGVVDIHAAREQLVKNGVHLTEEPKLGRDGKWQLNLYDPDQTRIEFMEFTPKEKPCCSEFTGPHPKP